MRGGEGMKYLKLILLLLVIYPLALYVVNFWMSR
nr:MAG TPA: hypothetical protein [Caudoviricetes sp.]